MTPRFTCALILLGTILALLGWVTAPALAVPSAGPPQWVITSVAGPTHFKPKELEGAVTEKSKVVTGLSSTANITAGLRVSGNKVPSGTTVAKVLSATEIELSAAIEGSGSATVKETLTFFLSEDLYVVSATNVGGEATSGPITIKDSLVESKAEVTGVEDNAVLEGKSGIYGDAFTANPLSHTFEIAGKEKEKSKFITALSNTTGISVGDEVSGTKIPGGTTVALVKSSTEIELSAAVEGAGEGEAGVTLTVAGPGCAVLSPSSVNCAYAGRVDVGDILSFAVKVKVTASQGEQIKNTATVSGGAPSPATTSPPTTEPTPVTSEPVPFGVASLFTAASTAQAGAHPNFTTSITPNWGELEPGTGSPLPPAALRDVGVNVPPGLSGDPLAVPRCDIGRLRRQTCPGNTTVGVATVRTQGGDLFTQLVHNITPYPNEPAAFAFQVDRGTATGRIDTSVIPNANGEYVVRASVSEVNDSEAVLASSVTLWGTPALHNGPGEDHATECARVPEQPCITFGGPEGVEGDGDVTEKSEIVKGLPSTTGVFTGSVVSGTKVAPGTVVAEVKEHEVKLSKPVEGGGSFTHHEVLTFVLAREGKVTEKSTLVTGLLPSTAGVFAGSVISGTKVAPGTFVSKVINATEIELSNAVEGGGSATVPENLTFSGAEAKAFMRNPTSCVGPLTVGFELDSWQERRHQVPASSPYPTPGQCGLLSPLFTPALEVTPETTQAGAPSGYTVRTEVHQSESAKDLATPDLKDASITLPEGTVASPSAANGLEACSDEQFNKSSVDEAHCPPASEIGKVRIKTPLLKEEVTGQLFVGQPECSPCGPSEAAEGKLLRLFLQAQLAEPGVPAKEVVVRIKLAGSTQVNQQTGQLTSVFKNNPQQPFEKLTVQTDGGADAPLANPSTCGPATTTSVLVPWSSTAGEPFAKPSSTFQVTGCGAQQFAPAFSAGTTGSSQAGAYSPLSVTFSRTDKDQFFGGITTQTPPGLAGYVSHVTVCGEPQASQGACAPDSQIGTVASAAGPGPTPFWVTNGRAYLTGPYKGAPFGLSIVVPTKAGPFDLGDEHLRAALFVDPYTGAITTVSDPLPTAKDGIPFQVKTVNVNVNRSQFIFNATNCNQMAISATISPTAGTPVRVSSPYQAHNCASLPFAPEFSAEAGAHGSKANGTSFIVKVKARPGEANIAKTFLALPIALPSRLDTIQKACLAATFEENPARCPEGSNIGMAVAHTPLLKSPLVGPAYLISHGGGAFPDVEFVLQGENVTVILDGKTDIKKGITYSRFETLPDAPVSTFETVLPAGPHSALTTFVPGPDQYNLCNTTLLMPTEITGQNGAVIKKTTHIGLIGCAAGKPTVRVARVRVKGNALLVTVSASAAGTVKISGRGLKTTTKGVAAGTHQIRVALTKAGRSMRKHHKKTTVKVTLIVGKQAVAKATSARL